MSLELTRVDRQQKQIAVRYPNALQAPGSKKTRLSSCWSTEIDQSRLISSYRFPNEDENVRQMPGSMFVWLRRCRLSICLSEMWICLYDASHIVAWEPSRGFAVCSLQTVIHLVVLSARLPKCYKKCTSRIIGERQNRQHAIHDVTRQPLKEHWHWNAYSGWYCTYVVVNRDSKSKLFYLKFFCF